MSDTQVEIPDEDDGPWMFRPRSGGPPGCRYVGSWVLQFLAETHKEDAATAYAGIPGAWCVVEKLNRDGTVEIVGEPWKADETAEISEPDNYPAAIKSRREEAEALWQEYMNILKRRRGRA